MVENGAQIYKEVAESVKPDDMATIIYTPGTTGDPKGAMLTHNNFTSNVRAGLKVISVTHEDTLLSFLPLSHVFERMVGHYLAIYCGAEIAYAESPFTVANNMKEVRPTVMASVPRLYEMMHDKILKGVRDSPPIKQKIFNWAVNVGKKKSQAIQRGESPNLILSLKVSVANKLVFSKVKEATGGRLRFFVSGGALLPQAIAEFFHAAGILILEGYGLTEASPVITANSEHHFKFGTVGHPLPSVEVKIAEDGEILSRGPHIMLGYFSKPDETAEAIDEEGWFHTGDIGEFDEDSFLRITDRKKNILVLSNGKNVAPQPIENELKRSEYVNQIMLLGDQEKSIAALIVPNFDSIKSYAKENQIDAPDISALLETKEINQLIRNEITKYGGIFSDFERVKMFKLLDREFSADTGEMTPTLKLKRKVIIGNNKDGIAEMYG
ncbi:TPA: long-chain fatty acid--CoA ligase [Candidatus Poribacteria bacterium]|nr:long-chain fatty acid--CoA ligase [Candidatus Poribacteria bacterium]HIC02354.1 long-chain fatty acid--CoA ligase [Candidatus Poribacteria bacterium]HIN28463.1 long-chain fatty acid--CoA ligase [Candidatus Poribacteria bacterium]HIO08367.1 long-chain fatty acid--CoA ligase [Candidatus Poribacteria bacterium]HIO46309.1 long-chain fatty acid--CoA ligase [Candidatus Poribacteria bacterium]